MMVGGSADAGGPREEAMAVPRSWGGPGSRRLTAGGDSAATVVLAGAAAGRSCRRGMPLARWSRPAAGEGPQDDSVGAASVAMFYNNNYYLISSLIIIKYGRHGTLVGGAAGRSCCRGTPLAQWLRAAAGAGPRDNLVDAVSVAALYNHNYNLF